MRVDKLLALSMIYLVLSLMFSTPFVLATIYKVDISGQDQAPGVVRADDTIKVNTESVMPCTVKADFTNNTYQSMICGSGTPLVCTYTTQLSNITGSITATIKEDSSGDTRQAKAYVDIIPPTINTLSTASLGNKVKAVYTAIDQSNEYFPTNCSGLERIELILNNQVVNTTNQSVGDCNVQGAVTGTISEYAGKVNVSLRIYDYVGLSDNKTGSQVFIESQKPVIKEAKAYVPGTDQEITRVSTQSNQSRKVDIEVSIEDAAIASTNSVKGDLSGLDKKNTGQQLVKAICAREDWNNTHECRFENINLNPATGSSQITITATDKVGNTAQENISMSFEVLNDAGTVTRLGPEPGNCYQDTCYLKDGVNKIIAYISSSSSFNESNVKINGEQAECNYNTTWTCTADISVSGASLELEGYDDLGNPISGESDLSLVIDSQAPVRTSPINYTPLCPTSSESLTIKFNVTETKSHEVSIKADTAAISTDNETSAQCTEIQSGKWECVLSISNLEDAEINTNLDLIVSDLAGNQLTQSMPVSICVEVQEEPDLIEKVVTRGTLPKVDRKVASKITVKVPLSLEIKTKRANVEILDRSIVDCSDTPGLAGQAYMISDDGLKPILILPLSYDDDWDEEDLVEVNCTQEYNIKHGNKLYTLPEPEQISAELEVYNQALGTVDDAMEKKLDDMKKNLLVLDKKIARHEKTHKWLGTICKTLEVIGEVNSVLQTVKSGIYSVCLVIAGTGAGFPIAEGLWIQIQNTIGCFQSFVDSMLWPQGWVPIGSNTIGLIFKFLCSLYTCKFYDANTYADIAISLLAHFATKSTAKVYDSESGEYNYKFKGKMYEGKSFSSFTDDDDQISGLNNFFQKWTPKNYDPRALMISDRMDDAVNAFMGDEGSWIYNPYKSKHYDVMCYPAQLFNLRKERQLLCKRLGCMEQMVASGGPIAACDSEYALDMCMYVESARYKIDKPMSFGRFFGNNLFKAICNNLAGFGTTLIYLFAFPGCMVYQIPMGCEVDIELTTGGPHSLACGITGTLLSIREIIEFARNPFNAKKSNVPVDLPLGSPDFCSGVDYGASQGDGYGYV